MPLDALAPLDPFVTDDVLSMTHQPEAPNPVPDIVKPAAEFLTSGDMAPVHLPGTEPKDYLRELQNPDIMARNIEQASNFAGMAGTLGRPIGSFTNPILTNPAIAAKVRELLAAGKTEQEVSNALGVSRNAVTHYRRSQGLQGEYGQVGDLRSNQANIDTIQEMLNSGRSFRDIGEHFGTSRDKIAGIVKRLGIKGQTSEGGPISLPSFEFMKKSGVATDKDYVNALNKYIEENGYGVKVEQVDHDPFEPLARKVEERGRAGRPTVTTPFKTGADDQILQEGMRRYQLTSPDGKKYILAYHGSPHGDKK